MATALVAGIDAVADRLRLGDEEATLNELVGAKAPPGAEQRHPVGR
jgi:hypothetical protein